MGYSPWSCKESDMTKQLMDIVNIWGFAGHLVYAPTIDVCHCRAQTACFITLGSHFPMEVQLPFILSWRPEAT